MSPEASLRGARMLLKVAASLDRTGRNGLARDVREALALLTSALPSDTPAQWRILDAHERAGEREV